MVKVKLLGTVVLKTELELTVFYDTGRRAMDK